MIWFDLVEIGNSLAIHFTTSLPASPVAKGCQEHSQPTLNSSKTIDDDDYNDDEFRLHR